MKVSNDNIKAKAIDGYEVLDAAADKINEESSGEQEKLSRLDQKAAGINGFLKLFKKPEDSFSEVMPCPSFTDDQQAVSPEAYIARVTDMLKVAEKMKANLLREIQYKSGSYSVGELEVLIQRADEVQKLIRKANANIAAAYAEKVLNELAADDEG